MMSKIIDLHTHTTASDGSMSPGELVRYAKSRGLAAVAVTDHDTVDGLEEALSEGEKAGIEVIPGVEISVDFEPEMHMLGYFPCKTFAKIAGVLNELRKNREERNPRIVKKLNEMGFNLTMYEVKKEAKGKVVGRPHIARVMVEKGYVNSIEEAFEKYLADGRPAYFKKGKLTPEQGIQEILKAEGIPVLAHPKYLYMDMAGLDVLLKDLKAKGLKGIEAYYVDNTPEETEEFLRLADKHGLIVTGGSDFHGSYKSRIEIGVGYGNLKVPYELLDNLRCI